MKILYVEDNPIDSDLARRALAKAAPQIAIDIVETFQEAVSRLEKIMDYDLILIDLKLPDGDGLSLLAHIREIGLSCAIVVISGQGDEESAVAALKTGADDYIVKHKDYLAQLPITLENALQRHSAKLELHARPLKVLYGEHHAVDIDLTRRHLAHYAPFIRLEVVNTPPEIKQRLSDPKISDKFDVILLDYSLPGLNTLDRIKDTIQERGVEVPIVLVTGRGSEEIAVQAIKLGAADYVVKNPGYLFKLPIVLENAFQRAQLRREQAALHVSEQELRMVFDTMTEGIALNENIYDENGEVVDYRIVKVNQAFLSITSIPERDAIGGVATKLYGMTSEFIREFWKQHQEKVSAAYTEMFISERWFIVSTSPFVNDRFVTTFFEITERKLAEVALLESDGKLKVAQEIGRIGSWEFDLKSQKISWSDQTFVLYERDPQKGPPSAEEEAGYYSPEQAQTLRENARLAIETGQDFEYDLQVNLPSGHQAIFAARMQPIKDEQDQVIKLFGTVQDITLRKQAEEQIRYQANLLANVSDAIIATDMQYNIQHWNEAAHKQYGWTSKEVLGHPLSDFIQNEYLGDTLDDIQFKISQDGNWKGEVTQNRRNGERFPVLTTLSQVKDRQDKPVGFIAINRDISARKLMEESLAASEAELRALFASMQDIVLVIDHEGIYRKIAPTNPSLLYRPPEELLGKNLTDVFPIEQAAHFLDVVQQVLKTGQTDSIEYELTIGENKVWFVVSITAMTEDSTVWVARDITRRKLAEEQIQNQMETLGALYDLSRKLLEMDDFNSMLDLVTMKVVESVHVTFACIILLEQEDLFIRSAYPARILDINFPLNEGNPLADHPLCKRVLDEKTPFIVQKGDPAAGEFTTFFLGVSPILCLVPLHENHQPFGILVLGEQRSENREPFSPEKIRLASSISDQAASALHRALLREQANHRLRRITSLREIDSTIAASFDIRLSLEVILKHVEEQLKVDAVAVLVVNSSLQRLVYKGGRGFRSQAIENIDQRLDEGQAGQSILERRMIKIQDVASSGAFFAQSELMKAEQFSVYIAMPLIVKGKANGVLEIFHRSPLDPDEEWFEFLNTLAGQTALAIDNDQLFYGLQRSNIELGLAYDATIEGWSHALELRDKETEGHSMRVTEMTVNMARSLRISNDNLKPIRWGALLHDIGKMGVPDSILLKPGPLTDEEWVIMKQHPVFSFKMLSPIQYLKDALGIPYCHHEKWDGSGYPRSLKREQIPLEARIFAVVDVWDALTSDRPYRKAWSRAKALEYIKSESGTHFDPQVLVAFLKMVATG